MTTEQVLTILREYKRTAAEKYGIEQIGIFGSVARGEQNDKSDIDVCVKLRKGDLFILYNMMEELQELFHKKVDVLTIHENMRRLFRQNLERDAIFV